MASSLLFRRRYLAARGRPLPTSSPYSLQGASEKIHFHRFVRQLSLQSKNLLAQDKFARTPGRKTRILQSVTPMVKQMACYADFPRKPRDVVACVHSFNGLLPKLFAVSLTFFRSTLQVPSCKVCNTRVSQSRGFTPLAQNAREWILESGEML